jgi:hypothetical protein
MPTKSTSAFARAAHNPAQLGILDVSDEFVAHGIFSALLFSAYTSISLSPSTEPL